ncbi:DUF3630 family protein [Idiomarina seosinensis]|uniref:DUF3630 family protein n=1 Tax=Idiomarina seosinensis TaxID=281739 RepID=UPI00384F0A2E
MAQVNGSYLMADNESIVLAVLPATEAEYDDWADRLATCVDASIRGCEVAADQYCWQLSINHRHWLLHYSDICDAAWLEPLEGADVGVLQALNAAGYVK